MYFHENQNKFLYSPLFGMAIFSITVHALCYKEYFDFVCLRWRTTCLCIRNLSNVHFSLQTET